MQADLSRDAMLALFHYPVATMTPRAKNAAALHQRKKNRLSFQRIPGRSGNFYFSHEVKAALENGSTTHRAAA